VDALYFDAATEQGVLSKDMDRLRRFVAPPVAKSHAILAGTSPPRPLHTLQVWLQRQCERGLSPVSVGQVQAEFDALVQRLRDSGFTAYHPRENTQGMSAMLLRTYYVTLQYFKLLGAMDDDTEGTEASGM